MATIFIFCLVINLLTMPCDAADSAIITSHLLQREQAPIVHLDISACPQQPDLKLVIYDTEKRWWGSFALLRLTKNGDVQSIEIPQRKSLNSYILSAQCFVIKDQPGLFVEVYDATHQGNGFYRLYHLKDDTLTEWIKTFAVDFHSENTPGANHPNQETSKIIQNAKLASTYQDRNGDGWIDVLLQGVVQEETVQVHPEQKKIRNDSQLCKKEFLWDATQNLFVAAMSPGMACLAYD